MNWLAHEADDWTIRSGIIDGGFFPNAVKSCVTDIQYSSPLRRRPEHLFHALTHIDVGTGRCNTRLQYDADWTANGVKANFCTWMDESKFYRMMGCYIAVH
jgi:hypothetical protein